MQLAFVYPIAVCLLAYAGMVAFCLFFVPTLENMYGSLRISGGKGLHILQTLRDTMPYWVAVPPLVFVLIVTWPFKARLTNAGNFAGRFPHWLPGMSHVVFQERCANFAEALANLVDRGVTLEEGLRLAAGACGDARLRQGAHALAATLESGQVLGEDPSAAACFPPFLRWALLHSEPSAGRGRALHMAANIYRQAASRRAVRWRLAAPIVIGVVLSGGVTLLYGLALFLPVVELLRALGNGT
jgi:type II secretory pathway component PulF